MAQRHSQLASSRLTEYFKDYAAYHKSKANKLTHYFGITFIVVSLLGLLSNFVIAEEGLTGSSLFHLDAGVLLLGFSILWYAYLDWKITAPYSLFLIGLYFLGRALPLQANWTLFILGWILQGIGHW